MTGRHAQFLKKNICYLSVSISLFAMVDKFSRFIKLILLTPMLVSFPQHTVNTNEEVERHVHEEDGILPKVILK